VARLDGDAHYRQRRERRHHAGQVRRAARARDEHGQAAGRGVLGVGVHALGGAVRGDDGDFEGHAELDQHVGGVFHGRQVRVAAHDDAHDGSGGRKLTTNKFKYVFTEQLFFFTRKNGPEKERRNGLPALKVSQSQKKSRYACDVLVAA